MSKSLGNFFTLRDLLEMEEGYTLEAIRYLLASVPYRKKLNFTLDGLKAAATAINRLRSYQLRLQTGQFADGSNEALVERAQAALTRFDESLDDDLNVAEALAAVFEYVRDSNSAMDSGEFLAGNSVSAKGLLDRFDSIFDVLTPTATASGMADEAIDVLIAERQQARKQKNFARSDEIRAELLEAGVILEDTKEGIRWKRK